MIKHADASSLPSQHQGLGGATLWLFVATTFTGSALLFVIQPMFAKMALPHLGGSPSVWNTCMVFFQATLLGAYAYSHLSVRWLGVRTQAIVHIIVLLLPLLLLPVNVDEGGPSEGASPTWWLLRMMAFSVGPPFFALATMAPLLQRWFATLPLRSATDPYFMYSASNLGSLLALLAFPFVLEPVFGVRAQAAGWTGGYVVLCGLASACALTSIKWGRELPTASGTEADTSEILLRRRAWWVLLAFVPSSLMLGVTTHISTDLAAVPLLWIVPLTLYLATFIVAFSPRRTALNDLVAKALPFLALAAIASVATGISSPYLILLHLSAFFAGAMVCHDRLARDRPHARHLTEFYLWLSVGGVLGGVFNTLVAPNLFNGVYEYPLVLALSCFLRPEPAVNRRPEPWGLFVVTLVTPLVTYALLCQMRPELRADSIVNAAAMILMMVGAFWAFTRRRAPFNALIMTIALLVLGGLGALPGNVLFADRNFFGVLKVINSADEGRHVLQHGTTLHGTQDVRVAGTCDPLSYFHRRGPIGQFFAEVGPRVSNVVVIGLGTGALACYTKPGHRMIFFEIDPVVERIAADPLLFTYLQNSPGETEVRIGDGRRLLESLPTHSQDVVIVDAFSSDSMPVHLMTREAFRHYLSRLRPGGTVALNISNRYLDLEAVVGATVAAEGLFALVNRDINLPAGELSAGRYASHWVLIAAEQNLLSPMQNKPGWRRLEPVQGTSAWTDDYSNILDALMLGR